MHFVSFVFSKRDSFLAKAEDISGHEAGFNTLTHLDRRFDMVATAKQGEFKTRQKELQIRKDDMQNEKVRTELLQAKQQTGLRMEDERRKEERERERGGRERG